MEEIMERPGMLARIMTRFSRQDDGVYDEEAYGPISDARPGTVYRIAVRRQVETLDDAVEAADGLRKGEQQILNLNYCAPQLREKIKDFMNGVNYALDGEWVELGENVFLLAPNVAEVDVMPATDGMRARRN
ncbi:MAG: cell division protein SepF [Fimbriimonadaceae bacterium]|nr:cell division protein SepF [Fimbriimonadaceae bacterium]